MAWVVIEVGAGHFVVWVLEREVLRARNNFASEIL